MADRARHARRRSMRHHRGITDAIACRTQARDRALRRGRARPRSSHSGHRLEFDRGGDRAYPARPARRRRCRAGRDAVLQQADAGRALSTLQGHQRRRRPASADLQHSGAVRRRHERRDDGAARETAEHRRRQGRNQRSGAATQDPRDLRRRVLYAFRRGRHCVVLSRQWRRRLHLGHRQRRAARLCRNARGVGERRYRWRNQDQPAPRRSSRCAVLRNQPIAREVRGLVARKVVARGAAAACAGIARSAGARQGCDAFRRLVELTRSMALRGDEKYVAQNRRARHDYAIQETLEAGLVLTGTEVKVLRSGLVSIAEAYAAEKDGAIYLLNAHFPAYPAARVNHEPRRPRKLLLRKREIARLLGAVKREGITLVPLSIYFNERGRAKLALGVAKGKRKADKRQAEKERDWQRSRARLLRERG